MLAGADPRSLVSEEDLAAEAAWRADEEATRSARHAHRREAAGGTPEDKGALAMAPERTEILFAVIEPAALDAALEGAGLAKLAAIGDALQLYLDHRYLGETLGEEGPDGEAVAAILTSDAAMERVAEARGRVRAIERSLRAQEELGVYATRDVLAALEGVRPMEEALLASTDAELEALTRAYRGGWVAPASGGDPLANPDAIPTGRNHTGLDVELLPGEEAWELGQELAEQVLATWEAEHGAPPTKVALTFWSSELLLDEGIQLAQALWLLGVEPVRNRYGRVADVRLVPAERLGRPRVDIVVQTSGQFRDLAASRIYLLNEAAALAAASEEEHNPVRTGRGRWRRGSRRRGALRRRPARSRPCASSAA